jgi:hypothetical protein
MATRYSSRYLGIMSLERFLTVERYYECQRPVAPVQSRRVAQQGGNPTATRPGADRASGKVR